MKANGAPEKLYLLPNGLICYCRTNEDDAEYTRTDAFVEKALAYLHDKFYFSNVFYGIVSTDFNDMEEMFEDFRTYMKGE